jgi:hypothetical protein
VFELTLLFVVCCVQHRKIVSLKTDIEREKRRASAAVKQVAVQKREVALLRDESQQHLSRRLSTPKSLRNSNVSGSAAGTPNAFEADSSEGLMMARSFSMSGRASSRSVVRTTPSTCHTANCLVAGARGIQI